MAPSIADKIASGVRKELAGRLRKFGIVLAPFQTNNRRDWVAILESEPTQLVYVRAMVSDRDRDSGWWGLQESVVGGHYSGKRWIALLILTNERGTWMQGEVFVRTARHYPDRKKYMLWGKMADAGTRYSSLTQLAEQLGRELRSANKGQEGSVPER